MGALNITSTIRTHRYLILRRIAQVGILATFILCNALSLDFFSGNLASSKVFWTIPMSDPLSVAQIFLAGAFSGALIGAEAVLGLVVVLLIYGVFLGRGYCAFVCPMNLITDLAAFLRRILGMNHTQRKLNLTRKAKYGVLALSLVLSAVFATAAFDLISPIAMLQRGVIFGMGFGIFGVLSVFLFDLFFLKNGFCGHICPLGATYGLIGRFSLLRVKHDKDKCVKCMKCVAICPEPQVLDIIGLKSGTIDGLDCMKCARCIEVCGDDALGYGILNITTKGQK